MGEAHGNSVTWKCVVAQNYLWFRDILITNPFPSSFFFLDREDGDESWVQFKYERLCDFFTGGT